MKELKFKGAPAPDALDVIEKGIDAWSEPEVGQLVHSLFNLKPRDDPESYTFRGTFQMFDRLLGTAPRADILKKHLSWSIDRLINEHFEFDNRPEKIIPRLAYVVFDLGEGQGVRIETVHGTHGFTVPEQFVQRGEVPTPMPMIYHVPFGVFVFDAIIRIGYCHDLAIFFAEEYVRLLNDPYVKQWGVFHASNPLYRVRKNK